MEKKISVWMISKWYPNREDPQLGVFIQKHARAISLSNNIAVLYIHPDPHLSDSFEIILSDNSNFKEITIYFRSDSSFLKKAINFFRYMIALKKGIGKLNEINSHPDIIHAYILTRTGIISWYLSRLKKIPFIISEQWSGFVTGKFSKSSFVKKIFTRLVVKRASAVTCVSRILSKDMQKHGLKNKNYTIIPNVIEKNPFLPEKKTKEHISVLLVADLLDEIKNISGVIKMISRINDDIPFQLTIIGGGPDELKLKKLASDLNLNKKIFFDGLKTNKEVYNNLGECDFLVMNSRHETFSLICAEAMSCGKPVLATRCGGPEEFVKTETGILTDVDNEEELLTNFKYMLSHYKDFDSKIIIEYANGLFSMEMVGLLFQKLYSEVINRNSNS